MTEAGTAERLRSRVRDAALATADTSEFRHAVLDAIRTRIPFDRGCFAMVDPATLMFTSVTMVDVDNPGDGAAAIVANLEYGTTPYANTYGKLARTVAGVETIRDGVGGDPRDTLPYLQILEPMGMDDEVRLVFRGRDNLVWGGGTLMRGPGRRFSGPEVRILSGCAREIGEGLRLSLIRQAPRAPVDPAGGPAVVVVGPGGDVESATPRAVEYLDRIRDDGRVRMLPVVAAAARSRCSAATTVTRVRTLDGEWLVIRAGTLAGWGAQRRVVVTIESARPAEVLTLLAALHGLTEREVDVLGHVLAGETRVEIGRRLFISPYTAADHLKSIYAKTGVSSRQELVAHLFFSYYLPRFGAPAGPDGGFARAVGPCPIS